MLEIVGHVLGTLEGVQVQIRVAHLAPQPVLAEAVRLTELVCHQIVIPIGPDGAGEVIDNIPDSPRVAYLDALGYSPLAYVVYECTRPLRCLHLLSRQHVAVGILQNIAPERHLLEGHNQSGRLIPAMGHTVGVQPVPLFHATSRQGLPGLSQLATCPANNASSIRANVRVGTPYLV